MRGVWLVMAAAVDVAAAAVVSVVTKHGPGSKRRCNHGQGASAREDLHSAGSVHLTFSVRVSRAWRLGYQP